MPIVDLNMQTLKGTPVPTHRNRPHTTVTVDSVFCETSTRPLRPDSWTIYCQSTAEHTTVVELHQDAAYEIGLLEAGALIYLRIFFNRGMHGTWWELFCVRKGS